MNKNILPPESQKYIEDFLTFLAEAQSNPETDSQLWENMNSLVEKLRESEDYPAKLAKTLKQWCKNFQITLNRKELEIVRANMLKKGQVIPKPKEGEKPSIVYNKAFLVEQVKEAIAKKAP